MAVQRILQGAAATLTLTTTDADGTAAEASGTVTVGVAAADGVSVVSAGTATTHTGGTAVYTVALTAAQTSTLELLTATWTNGTSTWTTQHEIVGGFLFTVADARDADDALDTSAVNPFTDAQILAARAVLERRIEDICDRAFVPRYARLVLDGTGTRDLVLGVTEPRTLRSVRVLAAAGSSTSTSFTAGELAAVALYEDGTARRTDGGVWPEDRANIVVEVEHGLDAPPAALVDAALLHLRHHLTRSRTALLDRRTSYTDEAGGSYQFATAGPYATGIPEVDAVYDAYSRRSRGTTKVPVSRPLQWQSQRSSMFHRQ